MPDTIYPITLENATPATTPLGELAKLMDSLNTTIQETAKARGIEEAEATVSLVNIEEGSNRLVFLFTPMMQQIMEEVVRSVEEGEFTTIPSRAHNALYDISKQAEKQNWVVLLNETKETRQNIKKVVISAERPIPQPKPQLIKGTTTIFGTCIRVGGKKPKIDLILQNKDRILHCDASRDIVIRLSRSIYKDVALNGEAVWDADTWELVEFKATQIANQSYESPVTALNEVSEIVGDEWEGVDAIEFVNDIRSGGGRG